MRKLQLVGFKYPGSRLTVVRVHTKEDAARYGYGTKRSEENPSPRKVWWLCKCDCGQFVILLSYEITHGRAKSCGCLKLALNSAQLSAQWADPEFKANHSALSSARMSAMNADPKFKEMISALSSAQLSAQWADPEFRELMLTHLKKRILEALRKAVDRKRMQSKRKDQI